MHCVDLESDRKLGALWERKFCELAAHFGRVFTAHQLNRLGAACAAGLGVNHLLLPDITLWSAPGEHHEIKHKAPTELGCFGLEQYRFAALLQFARLTGQRVFYTIHDHSRAGGRTATVIRLEDWVESEVRSLEGQQELAWGLSWVNGESKRVPICYWSAKLFAPLAQHFATSAVLPETLLGRAA